MVVLVCGSRDWVDREKILSVLRQLLADGATKIVHGDCRGADRLAAAVASELGMNVRAEAADWNLGRRGGPIRNQRMLDLHHPDLVVAFHADIASSSGTADMIRRAKRHGIRVVLHS